MRSDMQPMEDEISRTKRELNELFRQETLASRRGDSAEARDRHLALLQKELENVRTIARYVETVSPPAARDLSRGHSQMEARFHEMRDSGDAAALQQWFAREFVPHLRRSELVAHLVATSMRSIPGKPASPFAWPVAVDAALHNRATEGSRTPSG